MENDTILDLKKRIEALEDIVIVLSKLLETNPGNTPASLELQTRQLIRDAQEWRDYQD